MSDDPGTEMRASHGSQSDGSVTYTVTALQDAADGSERCVFRLEATTSPEKRGVLPYYAGEAGFWYV